MWSFCPFEPLRNIAQDCLDAMQSTIRVAIRENHEFDLDPRAALAKRRHRNDLSIAVARLSGPYRLTAGCPMTLAEVFRHDEVEETSDCFLCRIAEYPLLPPTG
jgi:hypothetical protein